MSKANDYTNGLTARLELVKLMDVVWTENNFPTDHFEELKSKVLSTMPMQTVISELAIYREYPLLVKATNDVDNQLGCPYECGDIDQWTKSAFEIVATHGIVDGHVLWEWCETMLNFPKKKVSQNT